MHRTKRGAFGSLFVSTVGLGGRLFLSVLAVLVYANLYRITPGIAIALPNTMVSAAVSQSETPGTSPAVLTALTVSPSNDAESSTICTTTLPSYQKPEALTLGAGSSLLTKVIEQPSYYQVYGDTISELRHSIESCPARATIAGAYHAITARNINWSYSVSQLGDGVCALHNPRIGLHVSQLLPTYTPGEKTPAKTVAQWNSYAKNLALHEQEHVRLASSHAENLAASLQQIGPMKCELLRSNVDTTIKSALMILDAKDELYDTQTNHGATQGAVL